MYLEARVFSVWLLIKLLESSCLHLLGIIVSSFDMDAEDLDSGPLCLRSKCSYPLRSLSNYSAFKSWIIKEKKRKKRKSWIIDIHL